MKTHEISRESYVDKNGNNITFIKTATVFPLATRVLVIAVNRIEGTWNAYVDAVPGIDHDTEWEQVFHTGVKLPRDVADVIFPRYKDTPYAAR